MDIQALRQLRAEKITALQAAVDNETTFNALKAEIAEIDAKIARHEEAIKAVATLQAPVNTAVPAAPVANAAPANASVPAQVAQKGLKFGAAMRAIAAAGGSREGAVAIAESWGHSGLFAQQSAGNGPAGGFLVPEVLSGEIIELLRPASVVMSMQPVIVPLDMGNLTMNRIALGTNAFYVGEQRAIPATKVDLGQAKLSSKKLAALVPISNDLLKTASTAADAMVRDDLIASMALRADLAFIRGAGTSFSPLGMLGQLTASPFAATNILTMTAAPTIVTVTNDLGRMELALLNANIPMTRPGWLMAPRTYIFLMNLRDGNGNYAFPEVQNMMLRGKPIQFTTQIPINLGGGTESELYLADFAHVLVGEEHGIELAISTEAAYIDANSTMQASFSTDETVIRAIAKHDFGLRHLPAVAILNGVTWGA